MKEKIWSCAHHISTIIQLQQTEGYRPYQTLEYVQILHPDQWLSVLSYFPIFEQNTNITLIFTIYFCDQTPPSTYRRQADIHYNSLPRASAPTTSTPIQSSCSSANNSSIDSNANPKRNAVAFGKQLMNQYIPHSATKSASNICHQQMVLCQHPEPTSISPSLCHGFQKQKGVSVPNLGSPKLILTFRIMLSI